MRARNSGRGDGILHLKAVPGNVATLLTAAGACDVVWDDVDRPNVSVERQLPRFWPVVEDVSTVERVLGVRAGVLDTRLPTQTVSVSSPKLIIPLRRPADVQAVQPNFSELWSLCRRLNATGANVFAPCSAGDNSRVVAR